MGVEEGMTLRAWKRYPTEHGTAVYPFVLEVVEEGQEETQEEEQRSGCQG